MTDPDLLAVTVDRALCDDHGQCVFAAPAVFGFDDDERLQYEPSPNDDQRDAVLAAAAACPVRAITVSRPGT